MIDEQLRDEADRLYWDTDRSVAEIADELEISRRALYDAISPRPVGIVCGECSAEMVFRNRSAAGRREAECVECEVVVTVAEAAAGVEPDTGAEAEPETDDAEPQVEQEREAAHLSPMARSWPTGRAVSPAGGYGASLTAAVVVGLAIGAATAYLFRRR